MQDLLRAWDGRFVVVHHDRPTGATIYVAVDRDEPEAAVGGTRMRPYARPEEALRDALRLSEGMIWKLAALDLLRGGGTAVIDVPEGLAGVARDSLLDRYADPLASLRGALQTGPDVGTTPADMDRIGARTPHVFGRTPERGGAGCRARHPHRAGPPVRLRRPRRPPGPDRGAGRRRPAAGGAAPANACRRCRRPASR